MNLLLSSPLDSFFKLISVLLIFVLVLVLTYVTTYWMGNLQKKKFSNKNLKVIETISVGSNKYISIVEVGTVYLVVSIGKDEVHMLTRLSRDELTDFSFEEDSMGNGQESFQQILNKFRDKMPQNRKNDE